MIDFAGDYSYSSARYYIFGKEDSLTIEDPLFNTFGIELSQRREEYKKFLETFDSEKEELYENLEFPQGSKDFLKRLIKEKGSFLPRRKGRARK